MASDPSPPPNCLVFGASGQVGRELVREMDRRRSQFGNVTLLVRRRPAPQALEEAAMGDEQFSLKCVPEMSELDVVDFVGGGDSSFDVAFCCIGTTLTKVDRSEFESVERDLVVRLAGLARRLGCRQFHLVSGLASSPSSRFFVPRVKGEAEEGVRREGPKSLVIYRPGLLRCDRKDESRPAETVARWISDFVDLGDWWSVSTKKVALVVCDVSLDLWSNPGQQRGERGEGGCRASVMEHWDIVQRFMLWREGERRSKRMNSQEEEEEELKRDME